jgi:septum formation protein
MKRLVLASSSPRRAELLRVLGVAFDIVPTDIDESRRPDEHPHAYVERLAREKAESATVRLGTVVLAADTAVVHEGEVLGKPGHPAEARTMLARLSGEVHHVVTGVAVAGVEDGRLEVESVVESARVRMAALTVEEIASYVATGEPLDKAGAYALQGRGGLLVESVEGHPTTIVGLPLPATRRLLARRGVEIG